MWVCAGQDSAQGDQKGPLDSLELGLQAILSHLEGSGNRTLVSAKTVYTINHEQSPLPLVTVQSMYFTLLHTPPKVGENWRQLDQLCGLYQQEVPGYTFYSIKSTL